VSEETVARLMAELADLRDEIQELGIDSAVVRTKLEAIERDVGIIANTHIPRLVPMDRYMLVEKAVFGVITLIVVAFITALISLVIGGGA
jgi:t-SNARE complex subunit (syntaxin)